MSTTMKRLSWVALTTMFVVPAGCALDSAVAAVRRVGEHDIALVRIEERLNSMDAALESNAEATAALRDDVVATREGVARIEGYIEGRLLDE